MDRTATPRPSGRPGPAGRTAAAWLAAASALGALLAFGAGRLAAERAAPRPARLAAAAPTGAPVPAADEAPTLWASPPAADAAAGPAASPPSSAGPAPAAGPLGRPAPELVTQVAEAARLGLEAARAELVARCVPAARQAASGSFPFTFNLTFDQSGREIARGINEDRRARAPEVASCLRRLPLGTLRVPAPGTRVGVRVALALP